MNSYTLPPPLPPRFKLTSSLLNKVKQPPWLFVFGHCFLISKLTKMIRTILKSTDHAEKVAKTFGALNGSIKL